MYKGEGAALRHLRMRVAFHRRAMGSPTSMPNAAGGKYIGFSRKLHFQGGQLARRLDHMEFSGLQESYSGLIIPPVFQPVQALDQKRNRGAMPAVSDDSTHIQKTSCQNSLS